MSSFAFNNSRWREQLVAYLAQLRTLLQGAPGRDLLRKVDASFLLFENRMIHLESRKMLSLAQCDAASMAGACKQLLGKLSAEQQKGSSILLLLPPRYFVATSITQMPGIAKDNLAAVLRIQSDSILPGFDEALSLAINPGSVDQAEEYLALWVADSWLSELFDAFQAKGIFLAAIKPRLLNARLLNVRSENTDAMLTRVVDTDSDSATYAAIDNGVVRKWLHVQKQDLEQEMFQQQWQQAVSIDTDGNSIELNSEADYFSLTESQANQHYCFFPSGALNATRKTKKGKRAFAGIAVVVATMLVVASPFIAQSLEFRSRFATLESQRQIAADARQDQAVVASFENEWGLINDFPEQKIREALFTLQNILSSDNLTSMEVIEGLIKIQGTSTEPQAILQRLEQDPMFTEVIFSRATNNNRYYIDLRLSTVNFEGYMVRYFSDE